MNIKVIKAYYLLHIALRLSYRVRLWLEKFAITAFDFKINQFKLGNENEKNLSLVLIGAGKFKEIVKNF